MAEVRGVGSPIRLASSNSHTHKPDPVDGSEILLKPLEVGSLSPLFTSFFLNIPGGAPSTKTVASLPHS